MNTIMQSPGGQEKCPQCGYPHMPSGVERCGSCGWMRGTTPIGPVGSDALPTRANMMAIDPGVTIQQRLQAQEWLHTHPAAKDQSTPLPAPAPVPPPAAPQKPVAPPPALPKADNQGRGGKSKLIQ